MDIAFRFAEPTDLPTLLEFPQGDYAFDGILYVEEESAKALTQLMHSDQFGRIWLISHLR